MRAVITIGMIAGIATAVQGADDNAARANPVVIPQVGVLQKSAGGTVRLESVAAHVRLRNATADTTLNLTVRATKPAATSCDFALPLPKSATVRSVEVLSGEPNRETAHINAKFTVLKDRAARAFLRRLCETTGTTAALEFDGSPLAVVKDISLPANQPVSIRVHYSEPVRTVGNRNEYVLPRSERLACRTPWSFSAVIHSTKRIAGVYSPTHPLRLKAEQNDRVTVAVDGEGSSEPGPFRLAWLTGDAPVVGTVFAFPPAGKQDGYFLWLLQGSHGARKTSHAPQEVTLVIDQSASMRGERLTQVRNVANTVINGLSPRDSFNIITYNNSVNSFAKIPVVNTGTNTTMAQTFLKNIQPGRGADYYSALQACLQQPTPKDKLPIVLFFTDGMPTSGMKREDQIRDLAQKQNPARRRIYAFSLGTDVNSPLLQRIAHDTGGKAVFVLPDDDITKSVDREIQRLQNPVLTDAKLAVAASAGKKTAANVHSLLPASVSDLFAGDQVIILGRYRTAEAVTLLLTGQQAGRQAAVSFSFNPKTADPRYTFIPRLWAARRIANLVETIRQTGATAKSSYAVPQKQTDPTAARLSQEILQLTVAHGVLTEYTAFLSGGATSPFQQGDIVRQVAGNFDSRAVRSRAGVGAVNQEINNGLQNTQTRLNGRNRYWDQNMARVTVGTVQQIGTTVFFRRANRWVDGRLLSGTSIPEPKTTITFGTAAYWVLVDQLTAEGRTGVLALGGDVLLQHKREPVLVVGPSDTTSRRPPTR